MKFKNNVKEIRISKGMSQKEFVEKSGLSQGRIADIEAGRSSTERISLGLAFKLAEILDTDVITLFTDSTKE